MTDKNMPQQLRQMANTFLSHRRMGEAEAVYRVTPDMHLSESNVKCVYVQTGWPETRYLHAEKVSTNVSDPKFADDPSVFEIDDRKGLYKESTTLLSKYERRGTAGNLDKLCYAQFCKEYDPHRKAEKKKSKGENDSSDSDEADEAATEELTLEANPDNVSFDDQIHTGKTMKSIVYPR